MKTFWIILAAISGTLAAVFAFREDFDKAFVAAGAGAVFWFLNFRVQLKQRLAIRNEEYEDDEELDEEERF